MTLTDQQHVDCKALKMLLGFCHSLAEDLRRGTPARSLTRAMVEGAEQHISMALAAITVAEADPPGGSGKAAA